MVTLLAFGLMMAYGMAEEAFADDPAGVQSTLPAQVESSSPWLDEVRAQRRAWEAQRRATKEAIEARRRWQDPWLAEQREAREQEQQRRRDEWLERIDRDRAAFRNQGPWYAPLGRWPSTTPQVSVPLEDSDRSDASSEQAPTIEIPEKDELQTQNYPPAGWNNGWYYNGY